MAGSITVRFSEHERYDINTDQEVVCFMDTTPLGSYHAQVPVEGAGTVREKRRMFKDRAVDCIQQGILPCEIELEEYDG